MFKGIKDRFKYNSAVKFLKQELAKAPPLLERESGIQIDWLYRGSGQC